jgi:hypothetical protein
LFRHDYVLTVRVSRDVKEALAISGQQRSRGAAWSARKRRRAQQQCKKKVPHQIVSTPGCGRWFVKNSKSGIATSGAFSASKVLSLQQLSFRGEILLTSQPRV